MQEEYPAPDEVEIGYYELSTHLLALEAKKRNYPLRWFNRSFFETEIGGEKIAFWCTRCNANSGVAVKAATRKDMSSKILKSAGISVAEGRVFRDPEKAIQFAERIGYPLVVKPASGTKGRGVTVGIRNEQQLARAWDNAMGRFRNRRIIVERSFDGIEARFLVVGDSCVGVVKRVPPNVTGDGTSTIEELIEQKNHERSKNPHLRSRPIRLDDHRIDVVRAAGFEISDVPPEGNYLEIDRKGGFSSGADSIEISESIHKSFAHVAVESALAFPGLGIAGVDILAKDFSAPAVGENYIIVEMNSMPGLGAHHFPADGEPRNAASAIIDLFAPRSPSRSRWLRRQVRQPPLPLTMRR